MWPETRLAQAQEPRLEALEVAVAAWATVYWRD